MVGSFFLAMRGEGVGEVLDHEGRASLELSYFELL